MRSGKPSGKKWFLALVSAMMILLLNMDNDPSAFASLQNKDMLPVLVVTGIVFLLKAGLLSAGLMLLQKLLDLLRRK